MPSGVLPPTIVVPTTPSATTQRPNLRQGRARCGETATITAAASARRTFGKRGAAAVPRSASEMSGQEPTASRTTTTPRTAASTSDPSACATTANRSRTRAMTTSTSANSQVRSERKPQTGSSQPGTLARNRCRASSKPLGGYAITAAVSPTSAEHEEHEIGRPSRPRLARGEAKTFSPRARSSDGAWTPRSRSGVYHV